MSRKIGKQNSRARRLDPSERRPQLLECAIRVFARRGLGAARHAEIAKEAEVSIATVFFYFPNRDVLVKAVLDEVARFFREMTENVLASRATAPDAVLALAETFADSVESRPDYARVWLDWSTAMREELWPLFLEVQENLVGVIANKIRRWRGERGSADASEAEDDARLVVGSANMVAQMKFTRCPPEKVDHFLRTLVRSTIGSD